MRGRYLDEVVYKIPKTESLLISVRLDSRRDLLSLYQIFYWILKEPKEQLLDSA